MASPLTSALVKFLRGVPALGFPRNGNRPPQHGPPCPRHGGGLKKGSGKPNKEGPKDQGGPGDCKLGLSVAYPLLLQSG